MAAKLARSKKWLAVGLALTLGVAYLKLRAPVARWQECRRVAEQLNEPPPEIRVFYFTDTGRQPDEPQMDGGVYELSATSECFSAACKFELLGSSANPDNASFTDISCAGQFMRLSFVGSYIEGFYVPLALDPKRLHVRLRRDGRVFYEGTPGQGCPERGFCVYPEARDE